MASIEVRYFSVGGGYYHQYLVYTDHNGAMWAARGGPAGGGDSSGSDGGGPYDASSGHYGADIFGDIRVQIAPYAPDVFADYDDADDDPRETIVTGPDLTSEWQAVVSAMNEIQAEGHRYDAFDQNSNTAVAEALRRAGLPQPQQDDLGENFSPGADQNGLADDDGVSGDIWGAFLQIVHRLHDWTRPSAGSGGNPSDFADFTGQINDLMRAMANAMGLAQMTISPLILDLDGDGVETLHVQRGIHFDHDGNGFAEQTGWAAPDDGLLVWDRNGNGTIDTGAELFGSHTPLQAGGLAQNGFLALQDLDSDHNGIVDSADTDFAQLRVWKDTDSDGVVDAGELLTLSAASVQSLSVTYLY